MSNLLENPVTGESMLVLESSPERFRAQYALRPHGEIPGEHFHPGKEQLISVLSGELLVRVNGENQTIRSGQTVAVPAGACHLQSNPGEVEAVVVEEIRPAGGIHDFFRVLFALARDGKTDRKGYPSLLMSAALFSEFRESIQPAELPVRIIIKVLSPMASALGYRQRIEKYRREAMSGRR